MSKKREAVEFVSVEEMKEPEVPVLKQEGHRGELRRFSVHCEQHGLAHADACDESEAVRLYLVHAGEKFRPHDLTVTKG